MINKNKTLKNEIKLHHSQNFLHSTKLVVDLLNKSNIGKEDVVIEIGPGKGIITEQLVKKCRKVYGIEYDFYLYEKLKLKYPDSRNVEIINGDFLKVDLPCKDKYKVFSNIPFSITAEILYKLTFSPNPPEDSYIIIQEEAARKYAGKQYNRESLRSLLLKPHFDLKIIHRFKNTDFVPIPKVNAVLLHINKRKHSLVEEHEAEIYKDFIAYAFSMSGKNLKERMKHIFSHEQFRRLSHSLEFQSTAGLIDLSFEQWLELFRYFIKGVSVEKRKLVHGSYQKLLNSQKKIEKIHRNRRSWN